MVHEEVVGVTVILVVLAIVVGADVASGVVMTVVLVVLAKVVVGDVASVVVVAILLVVGKIVVLLVDSASFKYHDI